MQPSQPNSPKSIAQQIQQHKNLAYSVLQFPALTVMVFARRKLGYRRITPTRLFIMAGVICAISYFAGQGSPSQLPIVGGIRPTAPRTDYLPWMFAACMLAWGFVQHRMRWNELLAGKKWHTLSTGISYLEPVLIGRIPQNWIYRFLDPVLCLIVAIVLLPFSPMLGSWVMFSAFSLYICEQLQYEQHISELLNGLDAQVEGEVQADNAMHFERHGGTARPLSRLETVGMALSTGLEPRLGAQIAKRAQQRVIDLPDDDDGSAGASHFAPSRRGL